VRIGRAAFVMHAHARPTRAVPEEARLAALKAENCGVAKSYLRTLEDGIRVTRTDSKGEREFLDDKGRADETKRTRDVIARDCK